MTIINAVCAALVAMFLCSGCHKEPDATPHVRKSEVSSRRECWGSANPRNVQVCAVSFDELINNRDDFDGSHIKVVGYAVAAGGYTYLYPSKDRFIYSAGREGLDISLSDVAKKNFDDLASRNQRATAVIGQFIAGRGRLKGSIGTITGDNIIFFEEGLPWEPPPPPPVNE